MKPSIVLEAIFQIEILPFFYWLWIKYHFILFYYTSHAQQMQKIQL